jgi:hypothetical protein
MSQSAEKRGRSEAILGELAELGLMLARELASQARACEDPAQQVALVDAFHKSSRAMRLTLALDAKLDRDAVREARDAEAYARQTRAGGAAASVPAAPTPTETRKARVRNLMSRLLWNESEGDADEHDTLMDDLDARLDEASLAPNFEALPVETVARRIAADMGLSGEIVLSLCERPPPPTGATTPTPSLATADTG